MKFDKLFILVFTVDTGDGCPHVSTICFLLSIRGIFFFAKVPQSKNINLSLILDSSLIKKLVYSSQMAVCSAFFPTSVVSAVFNNKIPCLAHDFRLPCVGLSLIIFCDNKQS